MDSIIEGAIEDAEEDEFGDQMVGGDDSTQAQQTQQSQKDATRRTTSQDSNGGISDEELKEKLHSRQTNITVIGCGGAGGNTITRMREEGIKGADFVAANTDVQDLYSADADTKILMEGDGSNARSADGRGAGADPQIGEEAAINSQREIQDAVQDSDMVFVTCGMGGGTGTGSAPIVAQAARDAGALTISVVTTPFESEGNLRMDNAEAGLNRLRDVSDTVIVVPNERLIETVGKLPIRKAFRVADEVLMRSVKGITELITKPGLVNLDFADVTTVMQDGGVALIGLGDSDSQNSRARDSVQDALRSPLLDVDISEADSMLVNVTGGDDMSIEEAEGVVEQMHERVSNDARIIWGTSVDSELEDTLQTMVVVTGVQSPQIYDSASTTDSTRSKSAQSSESPPQSFTEAKDKVTESDDDDSSGFDYVVE